MPHTEPIGWPDWDELAEFIRWHACAGARRVTANRQIQADAGEEAVHSFVLARLGGLVIHNVAAWANTVGARNACRLLRAQAAEPLVGEPCDRECIGDGETASVTERRDDLERRIADAGVRLTPNERAVLACLRRGLSHKATAREMGMAPANLRRLLSRIVAKLRGGQDDHGGRG